MISRPFTGREFFVMGRAHNKKRASLQLLSSATSAPVIDAFASVAEEPLSLGGFQNETV